MRDRQTIEREMFETRQDLAQRLTDLRRFVRDKIDVPARVRTSLAEARQRAHELAHGRAARVAVVIAACLVLGLVFVLARRMTAAPRARRVRRILTAWW